MKPLRPLDAFRLPALCAKRSTSLGIPLLPSTDSALISGIQCVLGFRVFVVVLHLYCHFLIVAIRVYLVFSFYVLVLCYILYLCSCAGFTFGAYGVEPAR